ncbi:MAG: hypothetical protein ACHQF3_01605 [Alphaproteobacteria bacterium]
MKKANSLRNNPLPPAFGDLAPYVKAWALASERERYFKLLASSLDELRIFHDAMFPRSEEIIAYLSRFPLDDLPADARVLYELMTTFVETAYPIDLKWKQTDIENGTAPERLQFHGASAGPT